MNNKQNFIEVQLKIDNPGLIASIENLANVLGVTPEILIETVVSIELKRWVIANND